MRQTGRQPIAHHRGHRGAQVALCLLLASFSIAIADPTITTVAGGGPHGVPALITHIRANSIALDGSGGVYFTSPEMVIYRVDSSGYLWQVAGRGVQRTLGDGSQASRASFLLPESIAFGPDGDLFVHQGSEFSFSSAVPQLVRSEKRIRGIDAATGIIQTVQGSTSLGPNTGSLVVSPNGDLLVSTWDFGGFENVEPIGRVHRLDRLTGVLTHLAGNGAYYGGPVDDGMPATEVSLQTVPHIAPTPASGLFIADREHWLVRIVDPQTGLIDTYAGNGLYGSTGDGGPAVDASVIPDGLATDPSGNLHIAETNRIRRIDAATGIINTVVGESGQMVFDPAGNLYLGSYYRIRRMDAVTGIIQTIAGDPSVSYSGDGGPAGFARIDRPADVVVAPDGDLIIAEGRHIRRVDAATGTIATLYTGGGDTTLWGLALHPDGSLYCLESGIITEFAGPQGVFDVRRFDLGTLQSTVVTGQPYPGSGGDGGPAHLAAISHARDIAIDASGNLYIADTTNNRIRRVDAVTNVITTFAGGAPSGSPLGDGGPATQALLPGPQGVAVDGDGNVLIADTGHGRIRRVDVLTGVITTVAGNGTFGSSGDGLPALDAAIVARRVHVDGAGNLFISGDQRVRRVDAATGIITTIAGNGSFDSQGDGGHPLLAAIAEPLGMALNAAGDLLVAANGEGRVRKVTRPPPSDLMVMLSPALLWPPSHPLVDVHATVIPAGGFTPVQVVLESVGSSEPDDAAGNADGRTLGDVLDANIGTADYDFKLRAERDDATSGRLYNITYAATDAGGNVVRGTGHVAVPHNRDGLVDPVSLRAGGPGTYIWSNVPFATSYDVIRGQVANLDETLDANLLGTVDCLSSNQPPSTSQQSIFTDPTVPPLRSIFFYLVGYDHPDGHSGFGTKGAGKPRQITSGGCP